MSTLAVIAAACFFVYWLVNSGGLGDGIAYRIRYGESVSGLSPGAAVLFNGITVGKVTTLAFDPASPRDVIVTIDVGRDTPIRADSKAGIDRQGLLGAATVSLSGGTGSAPLNQTRDGGPALLEADSAKSQDLTFAAREAVQQIAKLVSDNADPLHTALTNLSQFSDALARNAGRVDTILAGLERLTGGASAKTPARIYDLTAPTGLSLAKIPAGQLVVADPVVEVALDTQRVLTQPEGAEGSVQDDGQWADSVPKLVQSKIIETFENANYLRVGRPSDGLTSDYQLLIEIRRFGVSSIPKPSAVVALTAKVVNSGGIIADARVFRTSIPLPNATSAGAAAAVDEAFQKVAADLVVWVAGVI